MPYNYGWLLSWQKSLSSRYNLLTQLALLYVHGSYLEIHIYIHIQYKMFIFSNFSIYSLAWMDLKIWRIGNIFLKDGWFLNSHLPQINLSNALSKQSIWIAVHSLSSSFFVSCRFNYISRLQSGPADLITKACLSNGFNRA